MFTSMVELLSTVKNGTNTTRATNHQNIYVTVMSLFRIKIFTENQLYNILKMFTSMVELLSTVKNGNQYNKGI